MCCTIGNKLQHIALAAFFYNDKDTLNLRCLKKLNNWKKNNTHF